jgi:hypothetical protein
MAGLLEHADIYFCAGYNAEFFRERRFTPPYAWQEPFEVEAYKTRAEELVHSYGRWFGRVRPFVPICPSMDRRAAPGLAAQKMRNAFDKVARRMRATEPWLLAYVDFERRYRDLIALRNEPADYDVVLLDTLWGWPRHRYALHQRLGELGKLGFDIHARLNWSEPSTWDGSGRAPLPKELFPVETGTVVDYEGMLAASRLAIFATGFHWGWRSIMALALMWGLPIYADRLLLEPWFGMERFELAWNNDADWADLLTTLEHTTDDKRSRTKAHNQAAFDELLAPEKVAEYFVAAALEQDIAAVRLELGKRHMVTLPE